ncbi:hypothetical protein KQY30_31560 [Streptomyces sp. GMY02]|uniref:hypothetical protein n=1 Tax=Streptomyces sp. GMY02 TaxID=1333528 RepID=UPI001C2C0F9D|nr:hypothetical protein [Streptomyces sp. GMY02]QXE38092.1 hypothetical protein KQY30_31560 [Streptomyces sp. GMY02]
MRYYTIRYTRWTVSWRLAPTVRGAGFVIAAACLGGLGFGGFWGSLLAYLVVASCSGAVIGLALTIGNGVRLLLPGRPAPVMVVVAFGPMVLAATALLRVLVWLADLVGFHADPPPAGSLWTGGLIVGTTMLISAVIPEIGIDGHGNHGKYPEDDD